MYLKLNIHLDEVLENLFEECDDEDLPELQKILSSWLKTVEKEIEYVNAEYDDAGV